MFRLLRSTAVLQYLSCYYKQNQSCFIQQQLNQKKESIETMQNSLQSPTFANNPYQNSSFSSQKEPEFSQLKMNIQIDEISSKDQALTKIFQIYLNQGAEWKLIKSIVGEKFVKDPKNFVYNSLRKATRILEHYQKQGVQQKRRMSKNDTIISLVEVVNHIQKQFSQQNKTLNPESPLFKLKRNILMLSFWEGSFSVIQILELLKQIKRINSKIKSLGVFKAKHKRNWRISGKGYELLRSLDHTIKAQDLKINQTTMEELEQHLEVKQIAQEDIELELPKVEDFYIEQRKYQTNLINEANMILGIEEDLDFELYFF